MTGDRSIVIFLHSWSRGPAEKLYVHVFCRYVPAAPLAIVAEFDKLHLRVLAGVGADTGIERGSPRSGYDKER